MRFQSVMVIDLPGTTCLEETVEAFRVAGAFVEIVEWEGGEGEEERKIAAWPGPASSASHLAVLPGGFSFGDRERPGRVAARKWGGILHSLHERRIPLLGICNGFQVLCEAGLLPGRLERNPSGHFESEFVEVFHRGSRYRIPIAHLYGHYSGAGRSILQYADGRAAGILSEDDLVMGIMPHPERAIDRRFGSADGLALLLRLLELFP